MSYDPKIKNDPNLEPMDARPELHTIGTGVGAAGGAVAGAAVGTLVGGPIGTAAGGAIGAATGAIVGLTAAESRNPAAEDAYWSANYLTRDYVERNRPYSDYQPAYRYGWESRERFSGMKTFREAENDLERGWDMAKGESKLAWVDAKHAASDAWHRNDEAVPVDATRCCH